MTLFCTTIIPTVGRDTLSRAVCSILEQEQSARDFEVVVVNDSGKPLPVLEWQTSPRVQVLETNRRERSVARNAGAAVARGKYLHFLDDDDWILPGAFNALRELARAQDAIWLYGSYRTVDNHGRLVHEWRPGIQGNIFATLVAGESIPFQTSLLRADAFHAAGGFDADPAITGVEDRELGRRLALIGPVAYTPAVVAAIRIGEETSTTNWQTLAASDRLGREKVLRESGIMARLHAGIDSHYLGGRVCRAFLASAVWNLRRGQAFAATSRVTAGMAVASRHMLSAKFWRGLRHKQQ